MPYQINDKIKDMKIYGVPGENCRIRMDANESFLDLPIFLHINIMESLLKTRFNRYPDILAAEICELFASFHGISPDMLTASNGSDEMISILISSFLNKGEKILVCEQDFSMYSFYASIYENEIVKVQKEDLEINVNKLIETANKYQVRMIIFSNPCNPTGRGLFREDVIKIIKNTDALVVLDEAYMDFWDQSLINQVDNYDNLIILRTFSKAFRMASIRLGFAAANKKLTKIIRAVKSPYNVNSLTQACAASVLKHQFEIKNAINQVVKSRNELYYDVSQLQNKYPDLISLKESFANFLFIAMKDADAAFEKLLSEGIAVRNFGTHLRVTAGSKTDNSEFLREFEKILEELKIENN